MMGRQRRHGRVTYSRPIRALISSRQRAVAASVTLYSRDGRTGAARSAVDQRLVLVHYTPSIGRLLTLFCRSRHWSDPLDTLFPAPAVDRMQKKRNRL